MLFRSKLARCSDGNRDFWAVVDPDADSAREIMAPFQDWAPKLTADFSYALPLADARPLSELHLLAPRDPGVTVVACGATYSKHIVDLGLEPPKRPSAFLRTSQSVVGPEDDISYPEITNALDYEAELVFVMGDDVDRAHPFKAILGYTIGNEISARDWQFGASVTGMDMFSGKALDKTAPIGPWIVTRDEFGDVHPDLEFSITVDGEQRQHDRTSSMSWGVDHLVEFVNVRMALHAGDVVFTGTTHGVAHEDGRYLEPGQVCVVTMERIGTLTNKVGPRPN